MVAIGIACSGRGGTIASRNAIVARLPKLRLRARLRLGGCASRMPRSWRVLSVSQVFATMTFAREGRRYLPIVADTTSGLTVPLVQSRSSGGDPLAALSEGERSDRQCRWSLRAGDLGPTQPPSPCSKHNGTVGPEGPTNVTGSNPLNAPRTIGDAEFLFWSVAGADAGAIVPIRPETSLRRRSSRHHGPRICDRVVYPERWSRNGRPGFVFDAFLEKRELDRLGRHHRLFYGHARVRGAPPENRRNVSAAVRRAAAR